MSTKLICALGTGTYDLAHYQLGPDVADTAFAPIAARIIHDARAVRARAEGRSARDKGAAPIDMGFVLVTPEAAIHPNWHQMAAEWRGPAPLTQVPVPLGGTITDAAKIVQAIASLVNEGDELILDLTYGLRSTQVMMLLALAFVRTVRRDVTIRMVTYGAQELKKEGTTPLVDLTEAVALIDWAEAVARFDRTGDARPLGALVHEANRRANHDAKAKGTAAPRHLGRLQGTLASLTTSLRTFRFEAAGEAALATASTLKAVLGSPLEREAVRPLAVVAPRLEALLAPFLAHVQEPTLATAGGEPMPQADPRATVAQPADGPLAFTWLLDWLFTRGLWVPYVALLRELIVERAVDAAGLRAPGASPIDVHKRAERALAAAVASGSLEIPGTDAQRAPAVAPLVALFGRVEPLRKTLLHAGRSPVTAPETGQALGAALAEAHAAWRALEDGSAPANRNETRRQEELKPVDLVHDRLSPNRLVHDGLSPDRLNRNGLIPEGLTRLFFTLGTGGYACVRYARPGEPDETAVETPFAAIASRTLLDREACATGRPAVGATHVLATPTVLAHAQLETLRAEWGDDAPLEVVPVPETATGEDAWAIFAAVAERVMPGDRVALDVTHGLRAMPLAALMAIAYLRAARPDVAIVGLSYGALIETRGAENVHLLDLMPLAELLDWAEATDALLHGGTAGPLAVRLAATNEPALMALGAELESLILALTTFRFADLERLTTSVIALLAAAEDPDLAARVPALGLVAPLVREAVAPLAAAAPGARLGDPRGTAILLDWLYERAALGPFIALVREHAVAIAAGRLGLLDLVKDEVDVADVLMYAEVVLGAARGLEEARGKSEAAANAFVVRERQDARGPLATALAARDPRADAETLCVWDTEPAPSGGTDPAPSGGTEPANPGETEVKPRKERLIPFFAAASTLRNAWLHVDFTPSRKTAPESGTGFLANIDEIHSRLAGLG